MDNSTAKAQATTPRVSENRTILWFAFFPHTAGFDHGLGQTRGCGKRSTSQLCV